MGQCLVFLLLSCIFMKNAEPAKYVVKDFTVPRFQLDLGLPPKQRWQHIVKHYDRGMMSAEMDRVLKQFLDNDILREYVVKIAAEVDHYIKQPYADELRGVSEALDLNLGYLVIFNMFYDIMAYQGTPLQRACTSIVCLDKSGHIIHGRNMDFEFGDYLRNVTMDVEYQRNGKTIYIATHFAGLVGPATGARVGAFTLSLNERDTGPWWKNLIAALDRSSATFFFFREVLEHAKTYDEALQMLRSMDVIAPVYLTLGGLKPEEGAVVVGNRWGSIFVATMNSTVEHKWFVLETNYDPWDKPPASDDRRDMGIKSMLEIGQDNMDIENLYKVLSTPPVLNNGTVYTTMMRAHDPSVYQTTVRQIQATP